MTEEKIREIIHEEIEIFVKDLPKNPTEKIEENSEENIKKKTEIVTKSVVKTILYYIALAVIIFYGAIFGIGILAQILGKIFHIS